MLETDLKSIENESEKDMATVKTTADLDQVFYRYLGSQGQIKQLFKGMKGLPEDKRKELGADINYLQKKIISSIDLKRKELLIGHSEKTMKIEAETLGFDLPKIGHLHPITQTIRMLNQIFIEMGYSIVDGPEIETDEYNFRRMNVSFDHPARDVQDTLYIKEPERMSARTLFWPKAGFF